MDSARQERHLIASICLIQRIYVKQSLVNYSMGTAPDMAAIPEDIAAAITPAAAVQAVYAIRQQRKDEHRHLVMASAESDALRAQVSGEDNGCSGFPF